MREMNRETLRWPLGIGMDVLFLATGLLFMIFATKQNGGYAFLYDLTGCAFIAIAALLVVRPLSEFFRLPFQHLFIPGRRYDRPVPMYSRGESLAKKER